MDSTSVSLLRRLQSDDREIAWERFVDLALTECKDPDCYGVKDNSGLADLPAGLFSPATLELASVDVRPYRDKYDPDGGGAHDCNDPATTTVTENCDHGADHIQSLAEGVYRMAVRVALKGWDDRTVINLAGHHVQGDKCQGVICALYENTEEAVS